MQSLLKSLTNHPPRATRVDPKRAGADDPLEAVGAAIAAAIKVASVTIENCMLCGLEMYERCGV